MNELDPTLPMAPPPPVSAPRSSRSHETLVQRGAFDPPAAPDALGRIGRFDVLDLLGEGAMGLVYLARDPASGAEAAIKIMRAEDSDDPRAVHRFLSEARHMRSLAHPHILRVLEVLDRKEGPCYVMPYAKGGNLHSHYRPGRPIPEHELLPIVQQVAGALAFAHSRGIIHRDIKPGNVLLDADGRALLSDFGLVRTVFNDSMIDVTASHLEGTAPYMSPAVASGEAEDTRCDIYAFGALFYELLTAQPPYTGPTPQAVLDQVLKGPPPPIRAVNAQANPALARIAETCMARELRDRYATMEDVAADLARVARGAKPLGRRGRRGRRRVRAAALAAAVAGAALAGVALYRAATARSRAAAGPASARQSPAPPAEADDRADSRTPPGPAVPPAALDSSTPAAYVQSVLVTFARNLRRQMREAAAAERTRIHPQFERLFDGIERGDAETVAAAWTWIRPRIGQYQRQPDDPNLDPSLRSTAWQYVLDAFGAWEQFVSWSPELLRLYGDDLAGSLPDGAVFLGGTDPGRFVTTAFNDAVWTNRLTVITQNGLADESYLAYVRRRHGARLSLPADVCLAKACQVYTNEASLGRTPWNPEITVQDGRVRLTGVTGVMEINGILARMIFDRNKERHAFFVEESYVVPWMYPCLTPHGLVLQLEAEPTPLTDEMAAADHRFWDEYERKLRALPSFASDAMGRKTYAKLRAATGGLYASRRRLGDAELAFRQAVRLFPESPEATHRLVTEVLAPQGRTAEAVQLLTGIRGRLPRWVKLSQQNPAMGLPDLEEEQRRVDARIASLRPPEPDRGKTNKPPSAPAGRTVAPGDYAFTTNAAGQATVTGLGANQAAATVLSIPDRLGGCPVTEIGRGAFESNRALTSVSIPSSVTNIAEAAFNGCGSLVNLVLGQRVAGIGKAAFRDCTRLRDLTIPESVRDIGEFAFWGCGTVANLRIPNGASELRMGWGAFGACCQLTGVVLPRRDLTLSAPFITCHRLTSIGVDAASRSYHSGAGGVLFTRDGSELVCYPAGKSGRYVIPEGVTRIGDAAFQGCTRLTELTVPPSVTNIGKEAFLHCHGLTDVLFQANPPVLSLSDPARKEVFGKCSKATVRFLPGTTGWGREFGGRPTAPLGAVNTGALPPSPPASSATATGSAAAATGGAPSTVP